MSTTKIDANLWDEIMDDYNGKREEIEAFMDSKNENCRVALNPTVQYIEDNIFCILVDILEKTIIQAIETDSLRYEKSPFNAVDYMAEMLWNLNPRYPERRENWTYIFDMEWVVDFLKHNPRPYFPFSWIWSRDYAATKIQAYMRGYWVRRTTKVQEVRQFWKVLKQEKSGMAVQRMPSVMTPYLPFYEPPRPEETETEPNI